MRKSKVNIKNLLVAMLLMGVMFSCVTEYMPEGVRTDSVLVVDGIISNNVTVVNLTQSVGLAESIDETEPVTNARLYVECSDGTKLQMVSYKGNGTYEITTGVLNPNYQYRLYISVDGEEYQSEYLNPLITPEIDSISLRKVGQGEPVHLCVSTHDPSGQSSYYIWDYKEIWEFHAPLFAQADHVDGWDSPIFTYDLYSSNNKYYCWGRDSSKTLLLGATDKLTENVLVEKSVKEILPSDRRFSELYYVSLTQHQIRKEAYDYFYNLQKQVEESDGLFAPMPTDIRGNIQCITDPNIYVVGYIEVSTITTKDRFFPTSLEIYEPDEMMDCQPIAFSDAQAGDLYLMLAIYEYNSAFDRIETLQYRDCLDCRLWGTKDRPPFWPTNHY